MENKISTNKYMDELTETGNFKAYNKRLDEEIGRFKRYNTKFCLAMYEIDNFKKIIDNHGNDVASRLLYAMTHLVHSNIRITDHLFRVSEEEFIILFTSTQLDASEIAMEKIKRLISEMSILGEDRITISIGLTEVRIEDSKSIYKRLKELLYESKSTGMNKITIA